MRPEHLLNYGFTPTCQAALGRLADLLLPSNGEENKTTRLFDPCCGEGAALAYLGSALAAKGARVKTYGVEIEENRAEAAAQHLDHVIQGDFRRLAMSHRSISLILANPPYDNAGGEASLEKTIIRRCLPYLAEGGALALVIPERLLSWVEAKLKFCWLALFPSEDPDSPNQFVLLGQVAEEPHSLPIPGTAQLVKLPTLKNGVPIFRVTTLTDEERQQVLTGTPLPVLYPDITAEGNQVIHPLRAGHRAAYLAGYGATIPLTEGPALSAQGAAWDVEGFLRVAVRREEIRKEVDEKTTKVIQAPRMTSYLLSSKGLEEQPFEELPKLAQEIDAALAMQTYVEEDEYGWPATAPWEDQVLAQINTRLPEIRGRRGLLPPQAVRAVGMARALLAKEKAVYGA